MFQFFFFSFDPKACEILAPQPGIQPAPPALKGKVLTAGPPEEVPPSFSYSLLIYEV